MNRPTIRSTPGRSAGRPETVMAEDHVVATGHPRQQDGPESLHQRIEGQAAGARQGLQVGGQVGGEFDRGGAARSGRGRVPGGV